jgi:hypothetical protein
VICRSMSLPADSGEKRDPRGLQAFGPHGEAGAGGLHDKLLQLLDRRL